jgi:hypothetical protein
MIGRQREEHRDGLAEHPPAHAQDDRHRLGAYCWACRNGSFPGLPGPNDAGLSGRNDPFRHWAPASRRKPDLAHELRAAQEILSAAGIRFSNRGDLGIASRLSPRKNEALAWAVRDLASWRKGFEEMQRVSREAIPPDELVVRSPVFAAYTYVTNWALGLVEVIQGMPELHEFVDRIQQAEEEYMPSGPPMSPLTKSYFWSWVLWDMTVGVMRETLGSILLAIVGSQNMDPLFVGILGKTRRFASRPARPQGREGRTHPAS